MINKQYLQQLIDQKLEGSDKFVVDILVKPGNRIFVFIDSDSSVSITDCIELSRFVESNLDRDKEDFELNVSSPGLDHPYKLLRQYIKNIGRDVAVLKTDLSKISGKLTAADSEGINVLETIKVKKEISQVDHRLLFSEIKETKEIIRF